MRTLPAMKRLSLTLCLFSLLAAACARSAKPEAQPADGSGVAGILESQASRSSLSAVGSIAGGAAPQAISAPAPAPAPPSRPPSGPSAASSLKLIWTATLQVEVPDFKKAAEAAAQVATSFGGYVSDSQSSDDEAGRGRGTITIRIPSDRFRGAVSVLQKLGKVRNEAVKTQDVTKEYADLETRLKVKRETAGRLREILVRQTGKVSEVLEVEREIARVVEEIEQAEGERRYYDNLISLSTITLTLYEPDSMVSPGALDPLLSALRQSARTASESLGAMVLLGAALLPWIVALYLLYRLVRWGRSRRR